MTNGREGTERFDMSPEWVSLPELARRIGLSKEAVYQRARVGDVPGLVKMGRRYVVNYSAFVASSWGADERS